MNTYNFAAHLEAAVERVTMPCVLDGSALHVSCCLCGDGFTATLFVPGGAQSTYTAVRFTACDDPQCEQPDGWDRLDELTADAAEDYLDAILSQFVDCECRA